MPETIASASEARNSIANALVSLYKEYYGKGPTKAKTYLLDEVVVCILQGAMTQAEKTLTEEGEPETVREVRQTWQDVMEDRFKRVIEETLGRRVEAYIAGIDPNGDASAELFLLEPGANGLQSQVDGAGPNADGARDDGATD